VDKQIKFAASAGSVHNSTEWGLAMHCGPRRRHFLGRQMYLMCIQGRRRRARWNSIFGNGSRRAFTLNRLEGGDGDRYHLLALAVPAYQKSIIRAKESVLRNNLFHPSYGDDEYTTTSKRCRKLCRI